MNAVGKGKAVLMNLSPQWYNAYRVAGFEQAKKREVFMRHLNLIPSVRLLESDETVHGYEITRWSLPSSRTLLFVCLNPEIRGTSLGGGNSLGLKTNKLPVKLCFSNPVHRTRNERAETELGSGTEFTVDWKQNEAVVISFETDKELPR